MRHILAMAILGASLALTTSAALAYSDNSTGIPQRTWDGQQVQSAQVDLTPAQAMTSGGSVSAVAGPGVDDGYNPYRPNPGNNK